MPSRSCRTSGQQLGFVNKELAEQLIAKTLEGYKYVVAVASVTEPLHGGWHGCNILIIEADPQVSFEALEAFAVGNVGTLVREG